MFGGELDVTEKTLDPFEADKSQVRQYRDWLHVRNNKQSFSKTKKNMHLPIRDKIQEAKKELGALRYDSYEYLMPGLMVKKIKEVKLPKNKGVVDEGNQILLQPAARSTPDRRKRRREPTVSPEMPVVT